MSWLSKKKFIVPWDFSSLSKKALSTALEMADSPSDIHVIHVTQIMTAMEPGIVWGTVTDESRAERLEEHFWKEVPKKEFEGVTFAVKFGDAGTEIVRFAKDNDGDLIVMSSHGYSGLEHLLIGSVAERVVRHASCPVFILR